MTSSPTPLPVVDGTTKIIVKKEELVERETWGKKIDFLLSVIGFAVDLGNVWRFPYICYKNGGGAFLIPYITMLLFGGLPLFYMELALGQYQKCGCLTVWKRICPMFKGLGVAICVISTYVAFYYNTIIAWAVFYLFSSFQSEVPWLTCEHEWNTDHCISLADRIALRNETYVMIKNQSVHINDTVASSIEFFELQVLQIQYSDGIGHVGGVKWSIALCMLAVFIIVYFSLWKGIKSSGKAVWITATLPYIMLLILLVRGCTLEGAWGGIKYYITPQWRVLLTPGVWIDAAAQIFFSLGPGFGVILALSSYNKFNNNCYRDAMVTGTINCVTSFLAGFAVFSVLGHMAFVEQKPIDSVARKDVGLIFIVYPEAISSLNGSVVWSIFFFLMLITLGLDTTFGGLEAICTGILDHWPKLRKRREWFVAALIIYCMIGGLATATYGGMYVIQLLDNFGAPIPLLLIVFLEAIAVSWIYGVNRFCSDIEQMLGYRPGIFWRVCWVAISPTFLLLLFLLSLIMHTPDTYSDYEYPSWAIAVGWLITASSLVCIPIYMIYMFIVTKGNWKEMITPEARPRTTEDIIPVYL